MTKLTLSMEKEIVEAAKQMAVEQGTSVSAMFSRVVTAMRLAKTKPSDIGPLTRKASGLVKLPKNRTYRQLLDEAYEERFGK